MTPELETTPAPDPVTDDAAYKALRDQSWALTSDLRSIEREREKLRQAQARERTEALNKKYAATLAKRYPNPVADQVYQLALETAYDSDNMWADEKDFEEIEKRYREIVALINDALAAQI